LFTVNQTIKIVISEEDKILIESRSYETKGYGTCILITVSGEKLYERQFRQLDYVLILLLIVTVNEF